MKYNILLLFKTIFLICTLSTQNVNSQQKPIRLDSMVVNHKDVTLSGFSSGGTFAQQMHFSYAGEFTGIAVFSHTYYRCGLANGVQVDYDNVCTRLGNFTDAQLYDPNLALDDIARYFKSRLIEDPKKLKNKKLYVYAGLENILFTPAMSLRILKIFEPFIQNLTKIKTVVQNAGLLLVLPSWSVAELVRELINLNDMNTNYTNSTNTINFLWGPSSSYGDNCTQNAQPNFFIGNCGYSGPLDALQFLLGAENVKAPKKRTQLEKLQTFDQREFHTQARHDMDDTGFIYIPKGCKNNGLINLPSHSNGRPPFFGHQKRCYLHFYFHGCFTGRELVQENHVRNSGYLEIAETNNIIIVFPQSKSSPGNEIGCWDTYGITGPEYATQKGSQVTVVKNMLSRILGSVQFHNDKPKREYHGHHPVPWEFGNHPHQPFPFAP